MMRIVPLRALRIAVAAGGVIAAAQSCISGSSPPDGGVPSCTNIIGDRGAQVCMRWKCDRADRSEGLWDGSLEWCLAGDNLFGRRNALKMVNLYRFLAELPEVASDSARDRQAQQCALMMNANFQLSHTPPTTWSCYRTEGAQAAAMSNLASAPGVEAVDFYIVDAEDTAALGHRRWILSPSLGPVGLGSTHDYSCLWVGGGSGTSTRPWVAWPPPGPFPFEAFFPGGNAGSVNSAGWSIQSDTIDFSGAVVSVSEGGSSLPVTPPSQLSRDFGSAFAIAFTPLGWSPLPGHRYDVRVTGVSPEISYSVEVVPCL
jgi:hypothetical protein